VDEIVRKNIHRCPSESTDFRLPTVRNQQVLGSSPSAGSTESMATGGVCQSAGCCDVTSHIDIFVSSGRDSTRD